MIEDGEIAYNEYKRSLGAFAFNGQEMDDYKNLSDNRKKAWNNVFIRVIRESENMPNFWNVVRRNQLIHQLNNEIQSKRELIEKINIDFDKHKKQMMEEIRYLFASYHKPPTDTHTFEDYYALYYDKDNGNVNDNDINNYTELDEQVINYDGH